MERESGGPDLRKVDGQNRVALPQNVLTALRLKSGDYVSFEVEGKTARLYRINTHAEK